MRSVRPTSIGVLTKSSSAAGDVELSLSKDMLIYYLGTTNVCLRHSWDFLFQFNRDKWWEKNINEHWMEHDYALYTMVKTAQFGDLNIHANLVSKLVACHQHQKEFVVSQNVPSGLTVLIVYVLQPTKQTKGEGLTLNTWYD